MKVELGETKACLAEGFSLAFGLLIFDSFVRTRIDEGHVLVLKPHPEPVSQQYGLHAILTVDYIHSVRCFIVRHSCGNKWID